MSQHFKMKVKDIFFIDKKVVFAGDLETDATQISSANCKILVDGVETVRVKIDGEVMGAGHRDLWTTSPVKLERDAVISRDVWLVSV